MRRFAALASFLALSACGGLSSHGGADSGVCTCNPGEYCNSFKQCVPLGSNGGGGGSSATGGGTGTGGGTSTGGGSATGGGSGTGGGSIRTDCNHALNDGHRVTAPSAHPFVNVRSMLFDATGNLYVLNEEHSAAKSWISVFGPAPSRTFESASVDGAIQFGQDFARDAAGNSYVIDFDYNTQNSPTVVVLDSTGAKTSSWLTTAGDGDGIFVDTDGSLLFSGLFLYRFSATGTQLGGPYGGVPNEIPFFTQIARDPSGTLWVGEANDNLLVSFDSMMNRTGGFGGRGPGPGQFDGTGDVHQGPERFAFDAVGNVYAADPLNFRLMKLTTSGSMLGSFDFAGSDQVGPVAVDPLTGNVYVGRGNGIDILCAF